MAEDEGGLSNFPEGTVKAAKFATCSGIVQDYDANLGDL